MAKDSQPLHYLPHELMVEILARLPVKSLMRFKCVCKPWHSLISHPEFAKTHLSLASTRCDFSCHRLILSSNHPNPEVKSCSLHSVLHEQSDTLVDLDYPLKESHHERIQIVGSCNGLVCIATESDTLFLWNPSTRKYKRLPGGKMPYQQYMLYGFGYDKSIEDYKVVGVLHSMLFEAEVKVYTLKTDSWRRIGEFPHQYPYGSGKFVNGAIHWMAYDESGPCIIVSLDLTKETYGEVLQPHYNRDGHHTRELDVISGCLCILCSYDDCVDVWVMKEYGTRESRNRFAVIPYVKHPLNHQSFARYSAPWCISKNGEVLFQIGLHFVQFNPKDGTFTYPTIHNCSACFDALTYIESLVSPHVDADNEVQSQHQY